MLIPDWNIDDDTFQEIPQACKSQKPILKNRSNPSLIQGDSNKNILEKNAPKLRGNKGDRSPRQIVEEIFKNTGTTPRDASNSAEALTLLSVDLYTEAERFIFEILQNADDFPGKSQKVAIQFILLGQHLLILHDGIPFGEREVEAISSIGGSTKTNNAATTGYKGIGFKSVFTHSNCVYIRSGDYSFKYDSIYHQNPRKTPWQMKPIWVEECDFPQEIQPYLILTQWSVAIALRIEDTKINDYKNRIKKLFSEPRFILFLRNVNSIKVVGLGEDSDINLKLDRSSKSREISNNKDINDSWLVKDMEVDVSEEMREKIEKNQQISKKLKSATKTKLSFAIKIKDNELIPLKESVLFTYLPTNVKDFKFPFLVNADFITTSNREDLHRDNDWNIFIFEKVAYGFFKFLEQLCTDEKPYRNFIADLIPDRLSLDLHGELAKFFNIGFDKGLQEIAFIPPEEGEDLLKVSEAILDETGITTIIKPQAIKSALGIDKYLHFIDNSLKKPEKFKELGVEIFNFDKLVEFLKKYSLSYSQEYLDILKHLQEKGYGNKISGKQVQIIYDEKGKFIASTADCPIYFQPLKDDKDLLTFADFSFIHPDLDLICKEDPDIRSCLESLGVKEFNPIEIIKDRIRKNQHKLINKKGIDYLNYIWFIFKYRGELTHDNYQELSKLEIVYGTDGNYYLSVASDCYLSDHYKPDYPPAIAQGLGQEKFNFIVPEYVRKSENESVEAWRQFFLNIGVKEVTAIELVRQEMNSLLDKPSETIIKNVVQITTKIFNHRQELTQDDFERLSNLPILLKNNQLAPAKECYFAKEYQPKQDLVDLFAGTSFTKIISGKYIVNRNHQDWKEFFKKIKISEEIRIERLSQANIESFAPEVKSAFKEFAKKPLVFTLRKYLLVPDLIRFYSNPNFAEKIWKYISKNWDRFSPANNETIYVTDFFKFLVTEYPSIPCTDNQCRKPSDIYSSSLKNSLANCDLHISAIELPKDIEEFLGLKNSLDVQACLKIVDRIIRNFEPERDLRELEFFYQKLSKICHDHPSNSNKALIIDWSNTGKLIGCDDLLHPISQLFYLDPNTRLSHKRNPQLVKFPQEDQKIFESFLAILRIHKIGNFSITYDFDRFAPILPNVITERVKYLSIYLINSIDPELVSAKEQEILNLLKLVTFNNPSQLFYRVDQICFEEPIHNYYHHNKDIITIYYVGAWNSRKNAKIGEYLIKALELESKITSERLLDFLDDPIHEVRQYLVDSGFDIPELPLISDNQYNSHEIRSLTPFVETPSQGIGINPEHWGRWGEDIAKTFYEEHSYTVEKQADVRGYDFLCSGSNDELFVEVKTISSSNDVIRITRNEWDNMCKSENQEKYELFIVVHKGEHKEKTIRVKSAWKTLVQVLLKINNYPLTPCEYNSSNIEAVLGFQRSSNGKSNDIIFNWKRLLEESRNLFPTSNPNIEIISY